MSEPTPARRFPTGLLGMLAIVVAVELGIAGRRLDFTTVWADDWRCSAEAATRKARGRDVLCFGDSLVKFGVLPKEIEARTGLRSYNFAINAGTVPSTYFLLRRALESGAKPKAIVVDFFALMQPDRPWQSTRLYPDLATTGECLDLAMTAGDSNFFASTMLGQLLPSAKCRFEIRASIMAALDGRRASPWPSQSAIWETWKAQDGAQPMPSSPVRPPANPVLVSDISPVNWSCDAINATYVEKFLTLAGSRGIPVFWLMLPVSPEVQARRAFNSTDAAYDRFTRATLERHPDVVVLDARRSDYDNAVFIDPIHLDHRGAKVLSIDIAQRLADHLGTQGPAPRWVALPRFGARSENIARASADDKSHR